MLDLILCIGLLKGSKVSRFLGGVEKVDALFSQKMPGNKFVAYYVDM